MSSGGQMKNASDAERRQTTAACCAQLPVDACAAEQVHCALQPLMIDDGYIGLRQHALLLGGIYAAGIILLCAPNAVLGLHYQCMLNTLTGIRCPFCGMTRDLILMSQGFLPRNNPGSLSVAVGAYVAYPIWFLVAALCRPSWLLISRNRLRNIVAAIVVVLFVGDNFVR
jgi:Protein of unknown function (DUF2752)